ncbi:MAG: hypothetical protein CMI60_06710 [Parvibaculum sp.]|nr:hypothetical protein [Parvibaculum sp.]|tara:strand:- start:4097 stop:4363 length:267 start_codon:yes stop_codon:yes gene_type:complete
MRKITPEMCDEIQLLSMSLYDCLSTMNAQTRYALNELDQVLETNYKRAILKQLEIFIDVYQSLQLSMKISAAASDEMIKIVQEKGDGQ